MIHSSELARAGRRVALIALFYRSWAPLSLTITGLCVWVLVPTSIALLPLVLVLKLAVGALIRYVKREYGDRTLCYFTNRGLSPRQLWGWSVAFDMAIFVVAMSVATAIYY